MEVDHDKQLVYCETLSVSSLTALSPGQLNGDTSSSAGATANLGLLGAAQPTDEQVAARLSAPVVTTQLDTRNIAFERSDTQPSDGKLFFEAEVLLTESDESESRTIRTG